MNLFQKRLVIMITDSFGTKYLNISMLFKQVALYAIIGFSAVIVFVISAILVMRSQIDDIAHKRNILEFELKKTLKTNLVLNNEMTKRMDMINSAEVAVDNLEETFGISKEGEKLEENNLLSRIDISRITGAQKAFIMKFIPNGYPLEHSYKISADFGDRIHPILHIFHSHKGIDLSVAPNTPIFATADGVVSQAEMGWNGGYGNLVKISHSFGFETYYAHLNSLSVSMGQFVKKGQVIAYSGSSGVSTGPHLHYEVRFLDIPVNPLYFLKWNMKNFDIIFEKERIIKWQSLLPLINTLIFQSNQDHQP